jgi:hypothetical protein
MKPEGGMREWVGKSTSVNLFALSAVCAMAMALATPGAAQPIACPDGKVFTENAGPDAALICDLAGRITEQLASCNLNVPAPVTIAVVPELEAKCIGLYHCGEGRIEILNPEAYLPLRAEGQASAFAPVSEEAFFESIIRHELAHAALDSMPCPFASCLASQEYVAYTMQVRFLPEADRIAFEEAITHHGPVSRDMLSAIMVMMAPEVFAQRAWLHLSARENPCDFIGQIARGEVLFDFEHP